MSINCNHPSFKQPDNFNVSLWRYMSLTKFLSLLITKEIFLCRIDLFDDPFEAASTHKNKELRGHLYKDFPSKAQEGLAIILQNIKRFTYASCWHMSEHESDAFWKTYGSTEGGIAIQTTYQSLIDSIDINDEDCYIGMITYINQNNFIPENNLLERAMYKRIFFEHEKEVRIIKQDFDGVTIDDKVYVQKENSKRSMNLPVNLETLIHKIYISPLAQPWFVEIIQDVNEKYNLNKQIMRSQMRETPFY